MAQPPKDAGATTVERPRHDPARAAAATFRLTVTEGPDRGKSLVLDGTQPLPAYVGQGPSCALRLADRTVSRRHAAFDMVDRRLRLTDAGSRNGTSVDGLAVVDVYLRGGETIRLGESALRIDVTDPATSVPVSACTGFGRLVGASTEMRRMYPVCERLAAVDVPVLIEGETGTGKEVLAESLHQQGPRAEGPFVVFDCAAVTPSLVESDLFGHERGAFTGAVGTRRGVFELAHGGTLLIDEIGELSPELQPKLLRAIERSEVRRVGADRPVRVDVRILSATRRDLDREVQAGRFRDDLYHRLAVARVELPPLRRRRGDLPLLAAHLCEELGASRKALPDDLLLRWEDYGWPGNVRELRNAVARWLALGDEAESRRRGSPMPGAAAGGDDVVARVIADRLPYVHARARVLEDFERRYVERVLEEHGGNVARAAAASGIARRHFQRVKARSLREG
jgi:transcriptional regulator with GAF, ATPase, and Fis domain